LSAGPRLEKVTLTHREIFERYVYAGAISRNPDAVADLFTEDGVYEAPLVPDGHRLPNRLAGREAIRAGVVAYHREPAFQGTVNTERSGYVLHDTDDPDTFVVELDTVFDGPGGGTTISLVYIFRVRDGRIARLRDYFAPPG
jgi:ketosteroid isomerase-like protein